MKQLVLFRHAKAVPAEDEALDFQRPLAASGRDDAPRVAQFLAARGVSPDIVLVSEARRTQETWELARPAFPLAQTRVVRDLYLAPAEVLLQQAQAADAARVMIVAHNPGLQELALELCPPKAPEAGRLQQKFPTSAAVVFERSGPRASWTLAHLVTPADLGV
jgi:phosphohistidine phosphatase